MRVMKSTYWCDVQSNGGSSCLGPGGGAGYAWMESYNRLTDDIHGLIAWDYQLGFGGDLPTTITYMAPTRHCYASSGYFYIRDMDPETGEPGTVYMDTEMSGGSECCEATYETIRTAPKSSLLRTGGPSAN